MEVSVGEAVALNDFASPECEGHGEHGSGVDAGVELAVLAAGIDGGREIAEEGVVEVAAGEVRLAAGSGRRKTSRARRPPAIMSRAS